MLNNKGQVLVIFVILLPIFLIILTGIVDVALLNIEKKKLDNNTHDAVEFYLDNYDDSNVENDTKELLNKNLKDINITIKDNGETLTIKVIKKYKSIYSVISKNEEIVSIYTGNKETKKIIKG